MLLQTLHHTATHCTTLHQSASQYNTLQHTATHHCAKRGKTQKNCRSVCSRKHCNTMQHKTTHCANTEQHNAITLQQTILSKHESTRRTAEVFAPANTATHCNTLQHAETHCNTPQTHSTTLLRNMPLYQRRKHLEERWKRSLPQHTALHCSTLQDT